MKPIPQQAAELFDETEGVDQAARTRAANRSTWVSVVVNVALSVLQMVIGVLAHSQALVADGLHSLSDLLSDLVVLVANRFSGKASDADHHYGHYRYENAASMVIGLLLLGVAVAMLWAGVDKVLAPASAEPVAAMALWVAGVALVAKELLFRYMYAVAKKVRSSLLVANAWHARSDAASSFVALAGIGGSLLGYPVMDAVAALIVGLFVLRMGFKFTWDALHDLMDRAADEADHQKIVDLLTTSPDVMGVHDVRTRRMGDMILVDVHLEVDEALSVRQGHDIALNARNNVLKAMPQVMNVMTHVDPVRKVDTAT